MNNSVLLTISITGFTIAFMHAAIPTHWLPFVFTGRVQKWGRAKTLLVTAICGSGHVLFTAVLGFLVAWLGFEINERVGGWFPRIAGGALLLFGLFYVYRQFAGHGHGHVHLLGGHHHDHHGHEGEAHEHGAHDGPLVNTGHGHIELSVFESGVPPRFRLYFTDAKGRETSPPSPASIGLHILRPEATRQVFTFKPGPGYLESNEEIPEPHEFTVFVELRHGGHAHRHEVQFVEHHDHGEHGHEHAAQDAKPPAPAKSDWTAMVSLFVLLTFSPCEGFIPVYVSGVRYGWGGFALLTTILSVGTVLGMVVFTWLTLIGLEKLKLKWIERYESGVLGGLLCVLGLLVMFFEK